MSVYSHSMGAQEDLNQNRLDMTLPSQSAACPSAFQSHASRLEQTMPAAMQAQWQADVARLEQQMLQELGRLKDRATSMAATGESAAPTGGETELQQVYRELEALEMSLTQERQRVTQLTDEKEAMKVGHARDIAELEEMLSQVMAEKDRLKEENQSLVAEVFALRNEREKIGNIIKGSRYDEDNNTPPSRRSRCSLLTTEEPEIENTSYTPSEGGGSTSSRAPLQIQQDLDRLMRLANLFHSQGQPATP